MLIFLINGAFAQDDLKFSKVYIGTGGFMNFFGNAIKGETINSTTADAIVRSTAIVGGSPGGVVGAKLIAGYRINRSTSVELSAGIGNFGNSADTDFSSSEVYGSRIYTANDLFTVSFSLIEYEASARHMIVELQRRKKIRFVNARFGIGLIHNNGSSGISYQEHYWPFVGFITENPDKGPEDYRKRNLIKVEDFPYAKLGIEYESRGSFGFTIELDSYLYMPNLFSDNSVIAKENVNSAQATRIYLKNGIVAFSLSISFYLNRLFVKEE